MEQRLFPVAECLVDLAQQCVRLRMRQEGGDKSDTHLVVVGVEGQVLGEVVQRLLVAFHLRIQASNGNPELMDLGGCV